MRCSTLYMLQTNFKAELLGKSEEDFGTECRGRKELQLGSEDGLEQTGDNTVGS